MRSRRLPSNHSHMHSEPSCCVAVEAVRNLLDRLWGRSDRKKKSPSGQIRPQEKILATCATRSTSDTLAKRLAKRDVSAIRRWPPSSVTRLSWRRKDTASNIDQKNAQKISAFFTSAALRPTEKVECRLYLLKQISRLRLSTVVLHAVRMAVEGRPAICRPKLPRARTEARCHLKAQQEEGLAPFSYNLLCRIFSIPDRSRHNREPRPSRWSGAGRRSTTLTRRWRGNNGSRARG